MTDRLALTSKLVKHVRTPFMEIAVATMANQEMQFNGASFSGFVTGQRTGFQAAYAGLIDPIAPQKAQDTVTAGPAAGSFKYLRNRTRKETDASRHLSSVIAKQIEYLVQSHSSYGSRSATRPSDLLTQALTTDAKLTEGKTAGVAQDFGCRAGWFVARDVRADDLLDVDLQRQLKDLRHLRAPEVEKDVLPERSSSYSNDENVSEAREMLLHGARRLGPLEVEVQVANLGDFRAFGISRRGRKKGGRTADDPELYRESFELRYHRDAATEIPGWHGKESTTALPEGRAKDAAVAQLEQRKKVAAERSKSVASRRPKPPADPHEQGEEHGLKGDFYERPAALPADGPMDPLYELNRELAFNTQEAQLRERRQRLVPLSADHRPTRTEERVRIHHAGGVVSHSRHVVSLTPPPSTDGKVDPAYDPPVEVGPDELVIPVSRAFGFHKLKGNPTRGAWDQVISAAPEVKSWTMEAGDVVVLASHALFETRSGQATSVDTVCDVVLEGFARRGVSTAGDGASDGVCVDVARDLCDLAVRFGCPRNVSVAVARVREAVRIPADVSGLEEEELGRVVAQAQETYETNSVVCTGALYPGALRGSPPYRALVEQDARRMHMTLPELLMQRYIDVAGRLRDLGITVSTIGVRDLIKRYPSEAGHLAAVMADEADFYRDCPFAPEQLDMRNPTPQQREYFTSLAQYLEGSGSGGDP